MTKITIAVHDKKHFLAAYNTQVKKTRIYARVAWQMPPSMYPSVPQIFNMMFQQI